MHITKCTGFIFCIFTAEVHLKIFPIIYDKWRPNDWIYLSFYLPRELSYANWLLSNSLSRAVLERLYKILLLRHWLGCVSADKYWHSLVMHVSHSNAFIVDNSTMMKWRSSCCCCCFCCYCCCCCCCCCCCWWWWWWLCLKESIFRQKELIFV